MNELSEILPYILNGQCVLFIGAGISKIAGCYDWDSVVREMISHDVIKKRINPNELDNNRLANEELIEFCLQEFTNSGKENDFWGIVRKALMKDPKKFQIEYLPLIRKIKEIEPFPKIITTNIDNCLEETRLLDLSKIFYELDEFNINNLNKSNTCIFHIHGYIEKLKDSLLTRRRYLQRYRKDEFQEFLRGMFSSYSVLFLGYSLRDSEIKDIILQTHTDMKHFALVPVDDGFSHSEISVYLDLYKIKIIVYGDKKNFGYLLKNWIDRNFVRVNLKEDKPSG